eukprot:356881_1
MASSAPTSSSHSRSSTPSHAHAHAHAMPARPMNLPSYHIHRTDSEAQLFEDMAVAEYRDRCMFHRLITGIRNQQTSQQQSQQSSQQSNGNGNQYSGHAHGTTR